MYRQWSQDPALRQAQGGERSRTTKGGRIAGVQEHAFAFIRIGISFRMNPNADAS